MDKISHNNTIIKQFKPISFFSLTTINIPILYRGSCCSNTDNESYKKALLKKLNNEFLQFIFLYHNTINIL
jgi:hypothetical protein